MRTILVLMLVLLATPAIVLAQAVHFFPCEDCHQAGVNPSSVTNNVCLTCHDVSSGSMLDNAGSTVSPTGRFTVGDASDRFGNNSFAAAQTSHNWGATDNNPAAGASAPQDRYFYGRQNYSGGTVACSRCHDPHGDMAANPQLLKLPPNLTNPATSQPYVAEDMCLDCHRDWDVSTHGLNTHPLGVSLATATGNIPDANNDPADKYHDAPDNSNVTDGGVALMADGTISCSTCHGVHYTDSDGSTADGQATVGVGDGLLLKHNGPTKESMDTSICQTCHIYKLHGKDPAVQPGSMPLDCLDCHGGHEYDATDPNYFMIKKQVTVDTSNIKAGGGVEVITLNYGAGDVTDVNNRPVDYAGLCVNCHDLPGGHDAGWACTDCHNHENTAGSFGPGCGSCHGFPPTINADGSTTSGGWAHSQNNPTNRYDTSGVFKDESATPHKTHAAGSGDYVFGCDACHGTGATSAGHATHDTGTFQDVLDKAPGAPIALVSDGGNLAPVYNTGGSGTCSAVYCHSNGGPRGAVPTTQAVSWANGLNTINNCNACHGDTAGNMTAKGNSAAHGVHLNKFANNCSLCHVNTAVDNTSLVASAIGGVHVNGVSNNGGFDLAFNDTFELSTGNALGGGTYGDTNGTCAIYCHTNGKGTAAVPVADWDLPATGACGTCHQYDNAGVAAGTGAALGDAHTAHVFDPNGPGLACTTCHTHGDGNSADHVDGALSFQAGLQAVCNSCHGATNGGSGVDLEPVWTDTTSVSCETCHLGAQAVIGGRTAPLKDAFTATGHGSVANFNTAYPAAPCEACHATTANHFNGVTDDIMLSGGAAADDTFCQSCHGGNNSHFANAETPGGGSTDGNACSICHEPHGEGMGTNLNRMLIVGEAFDINTVSTFVNGSNTGVCQTCHVKTDGSGGGIKYYNQTDPIDGSSHNAGAKCTGCHSHSSSPVAFAAGAGTNCGDCHGFPPADVNGVHASHTWVVDGDIANEDFSDCAYCHTGADLYTYDRAADEASGVPGRQNHGVDPATQVATLLATVGYDGTSCATACHASTAGDGAWADANGLNCDACHGNPPAGNNHNKHIVAGFGCDTCHVATPTDTTHIDNFDLVADSDAVALADKANAVNVEATVVVSTWNNTDNTCANTACHNPSGDAHLADWDTSTSSCILCHDNDVASGSPMATGSHQQHVNNAAIIGDNAACTDCHADPGGVMAHRNGSLDILGTMTYNGDLALPDAGVGTCSTLVCHNDSGGKVGPPSIAVTPNWGAAPGVPVCEICHVDPSNGNGDHQLHWNAARFSNGLECASCHFDTVASNTTIRSGGKHLNDTRNDFVPSGNSIQYNGADVTVSPYNSGPNPSTCDNVSCHSPATPARGWTQPNSCEACHPSLNTASGAHAQHIDLTGGIQADVSECAVCHGAGVSGYVYTAGGNHQNSTLDFATGIADGDADGNTVGTPDDFTCTNACHASALADGKWDDANGLNCTACHNQSGSNDGVMDNAAPGVSHTDHLAAGMICADCHGTVDAPGTTPLTHNHSKDTTNDGTKLTSKGSGAINPGGLDVNVDDAAWNGAGGSTWFNSTVTNDGGNSCSNVACHNPSENATVVDWDVDVANCATCHGDDNVGGGSNIATGSHTRHLDATAKFGLTIGCDRCHPNNVSNAHFISGTGPTTVNQAVQFGGTVITTEYTGSAAIPDVGVGNCATNDCHNNGMGAAPVAIYNWGTPVATDCQTCHNDPPSFGRHATHLGNANSYGPHNGTSTWTCGDCHDANSAASQAAQTMSGRTNHINGSIDFNDGNAIANHGGIFGAGSDITTDTTITACNTCHGGQTAADLAKVQWTTVNRLTCESCHGDYTVANSAFDGGGVAAPSRAGAAYDTDGHGKANTPASAIGGSKAVNQACTDCHDTASAHITGSLNDADRLQVIGGKDYSVDPNGFCNACHTGLAGSAVHYDNNQTAGGGSNDGVTCVTCHDQHGQNGGLDAMIASTIQGNTVNGFTDRTARASYSQADFTGVCQVCHDSEVAHFNRSTNDTGHNSGSCLTCHKHSDSPIFAPSGCNGCHGGGTTGAVASNYWPDTAVVAGENTAGEHVKHMEQLSLRTYGLSLTGLLDDAGSDAKQKALCAYCHDNPGQDGDHGSAANLPAEVNSMAQLWDGAADNASYNAGADTCSSVNCHNGQTTTDNTYGWYDGATSDCTMCHTAGGAGANPNTGLHVTSAAGVTTHDDSLSGNGCAECHTAPAMTQTSSHINGTFVAEGGANTDRFLNNTNFTYTEAPVDTSSCTASCHSDNNNWQRLWSTTADSTSTTLGTTRCDVCHGQLNDWRGGMSVGHNLGKINDGTHSDCTQCHVAPNGPYDFASMHEDGNIQVNGNVSMNYNTTAGTCNVAACHGATPTRGPGASTIFPEDLLNGPDVTCNSCHNSTGGFAANPFAHTKHVSRAASSSADYGDTTVYSTETGYSFGCGTCHPVNGDFATLHNNGVVNLTMNNTHGGPIKPLNGVANDTGGYAQSETTPGDGGSTTCSAAYCHSDAAGGFQTTPDWYGGSFPTPQADGTNDYCGNCHGNQPTTTSHSKHVVGIHYDDVYTGATGLLTDAAASNAGHGDVATALTINCNTCHADTLNQWRNDYNTACRTCHAGEGNQVTANDVDLKMNFHVNGVKDVVFAPVDPVRSKAQIRDFTPGEPELDNNWQRMNGYKAGATSHDQTKTSPPLNTATMWVGGTKNCTVACHNGNTITWGATGISCNACHTQLPE